MSNLFGGTANRANADLDNSAQLGPSHTNTIELSIVPPPRTRNNVSVSRSVVDTPKGQTAEQTVLPVIDKAVICRAVQQQAPVGVIQQKLSPYTRKIFCWARILNGRGKKIRYIWYLNQTAYPSRWLYITNDRFLTWCPKYIPRQTQGTVRVEIVDQTGRVLKSLETQIRPVKHSVSRRG